MFVAIYTCIAALLYPFGVAVAFILSQKNPAKYAYSLPARFWLRNNPPLPEAGIWFHTCSYGETRAIAPFIMQVPSHLRRCSVITQTGKEVAKGYTPHNRYLPFEPLLWRWLKPQRLLVVYEAELWLLLFYIAHIRKTHTMLINARISKRSFQRYMRFRFVYRHIFNAIDHVFAQTKEDKERLEALGATNVKIVGNLKLASIPKPTKHYPAPTKPLLCAASTHKGEEGLILDAFQTFKQRFSNATLLLAPRHPERFDEVWEEIVRRSQTNRYAIARFSTKGLIENTDIILIDTLGELVNLYAISDLVIMGGSFVPVGGHNVAEAAQFGCKIITGPHLFNQEEMVNAIKHIHIVQPHNLAQTICAIDELLPSLIQRKPHTEPIHTIIQHHIDQP